MEFDDNIIACAKLVEKGDPLRFRTVMAAPLRARPCLFALYAFNIEVARAPWITQEPMIAEMRLQWWRDVLEEIRQGKAPRRHEVATPLSQILSPGDTLLLDQLVAARRWDIYKDPFESKDHFEQYIDHTSGHLMLVSARCLGRCQESPLRDLAFGAGIANWFCAIPKLEEAKRIPLPDGRHEAVRDLAQSALKRLQKGRKQARLSKSAKPAAWPALGAEQLLKTVLKNPALVAKGAVDFGKPRLWRAALGQWFSR